MQFAEIAKTFARTTLPHSEVELKGSVPFDALESYREEALAHIAEQMELPGFRKGHVPKDVALKRVGETAVLEEAVEHCMQDLYPAVLDAHEVHAVGRPDIRVTKLAAGNPVELTIRTTVYPEVPLPKNWKTIGEKTPREATPEVTEEDVQKTLESLRQSRKTKKEDGAEELPELTDEFAKSLGAFENMAALKEQIQKGMHEEKARAARDARRSKIIDALLDGTQIEVPALFVESELEKILAQMREDIGRMGLKFEDYLKHANKTEDDIRSEFREQAAKRAKLQLALNKIAEEEKIEADKDKVEEEMKHALEHFPDAKPELVRIHIETVLRNEKIFQLLEGGEKKE